MNDNFSAPEQPIVNDNVMDIGVTIDDLGDIDEIMNKIFEALGAFEPVGQPEPPTTPEQPHHGQPDAIADVLREPEALGFHDGVYYWEPWHVENDVKSNPSEATD